MTIRTAHCCALVLIACTLIVPQAIAETALIKFNDVDGIGLLTDQSPPNVLTAPAGTPNHGIFSGAGVVFLFESGQKVETNSPNSVSVTIKVNPFADTGDSLCMFIADRDDTGIAVLACFSSADATFVTLIPAEGNSTNLNNSLFPNAPQEFTLTYDIFTERATLFSETEAPVSRDIALMGAQNVVIGIVTDGAAVVRQFTTTGHDIPEFPVVDPLDSDNPWLDFGVSSGGNGAQSDPFNTLSDALAAANPGATISINPGTDSTEMPTINQNVTLANANAAGGSVSIGVPARSNADRSGFVSRPPPHNE